MMEVSGHGPSRALQPGPQFFRGKPKPDARARKAQGTAPVLHLDRDELPAWRSVRRACADRHVRALRDDEIERALTAPAALFASPQDVLRHPLLTLDCKRELLRRWAFDEYLVELAEGEGMQPGPPSRLAEVKAALLEIEDEWRPHPAAPAAFALRLQPEPLMAVAA